MKKRIILLLIACFIAIGNTFGQSTSGDMTEHLGTFSPPFSKEWGVKASPDENNTINYYFTLNAPMDITVSHCGSTLDDTGIFIFDAEDTEVASNTGGYRSICPGGQAYLSASSLPAGTYMLQMDWNPFKQGSVITRMEGKRPDIRTLAKDLGDVGTFFNYSDTQDTSNPYIVYNGGGTYQDGVCYGFFLTFNTDITISHCGSEVSVTDLYLLDENRSPVSFKDQGVVVEGACDSPGQAYLRILNLPSGQYYIVSKGVSGRGRITTRITGTESIYVPPITELATKVPRIDSNDPLFVYEDVKNTDDSKVGYQGYDNYRDGVCYRLTLPHAMDVEVSHCGSEVGRTEAYLLDKDGSQLGYNDYYVGVNACDNYDHAYLEKPSLAAGIYYIVSKGKWEKGRITTRIICKAPETKIGSADKNYILSRTFRDAYGATWQDKVDYFDEMGRQEETALVNASPMEDDLTTLTEYDVFGRVTKQWLPAEAWTLDGYGFYISPETLKQSIRSANCNDSAPYLLKQYESSPLERPVCEYGVGQDWHSKGKAVRTQYQLTNVAGNDTLNCVRYYGGCIGADTTAIVKHDGNYATGSLEVVRVEDEDGNAAMQFKNRFGQTVLNRQIGRDANGRLVLHDTYYIYDEWGNLHVVLPPQAVEYMKSSGGHWTTDFHPILHAYVYFYKYDDRFRVIAKKLPGQGWIRYVYDKTDYPVFTQDGEQRKRGEWSFSITDGLERVCLTGICRNNFELSQNSLNTVVNAARDNSIGAYKGYSVFGVSLVDAKVMTVNYYDDYTFMGRNGFPSSVDTKYKYTSLLDYGKQYVKGAQTFLTGTLIAHCDTATQDILQHIPSVMYYDYRGRMIQSVSGNHLEGGFEKEYIAYDFTGNPLKRKHVHSATGKVAQTEEYTYTYDHVGRLLLTKHSLNGGSTVLLTDKLYDNLGRLSSVCRHGNCGRLETWYDYNVRSWVKAVNGPLFSQKLYYNDKRPNGTNNTCYNGNISGMDWKVGAENVLRGYNFTYDGLSHLKQADYQENGIRVEGRFDTSYRYDKHGNITHMERYGQTGSDSYGLIDDLYMFYNGNQLESVEDSAVASAYNNGFEFKDGNSSEVEYFYDLNGNLTKDLNKNIVDIQYNYLNLPSRIVFGDGNSISYSYDATGKKLRTVHQRDDVNTATDYCGNLIYENGVAKTILFEGGYLSLNDGIYHYFIQDHQGNNRVVVNQNEVVEEVNHYYPFGGIFANSSSVQPYKYNGKELDAKNGLNWYDYGERHYDATLGRWHVADPMAEKYYSLSPYNYCVNNPILLIDPNGMWPTWGGIKSGLSNALDTSLSFVNGTVSAIADNMLLGGTSFRETGIYSSVAAYNFGQDFGDAASIIMGAGEIIVGVTKAVGGLLATPETGGLSLSVAAEGTAVATHGSMMATSGTQKLFSRKGRAQESGNNGSQASAKTPEYKQPKSGSGKEKSNNPPGWVKEERPYKGENGKAFAKRMMEKKLGKGAEYKTGPDSEYNKIKKYGDRNFE